MISLQFMRGTMNYYSNLPHPFFFPFSFIPDLSFFTIRGWSWVASCIFYITMRVELCSRTLARKWGQCARNHKRNVVRTASYSPNLLYLQYHYQFPLVLVLAGIHSKICKITFCACISVPSFPESIFARRIINRNYLPCVCAPWTSFP